MLPLPSSPMNIRPSSANSIDDGRPCLCVVSSQPMMKSVIEPEDIPLPALVPMSGAPVVGSVATATTRAPTSEPAAPWSATSTLFVYGAGHLPCSKSNPKGVSPMKKPTSSDVVFEHSGGGSMFKYGRPFVAQQGNPQSSPWRIGTSFSRPP